jgi:glycosyltransferase involved in cell wall biosynthesis
MPLVTVVIPTYNRSSMVREAVQNVLSQTLEDFELIVVDDGSKDDTASVIRAITDPRIKYLYKENGGLSTARNLGWDNASGDYLCFLDDDDIWPENFLEVVVKNLQENIEYGAAYSVRTLLYPDGKQVQSGRTKYSRSGWITADLFKKDFLQSSALCFRRKAIEGFRFDPMLLNAQDVDMWLRLSTKIQYLFVPSVQIACRVSHGVSPRTNLRINGNKILILERFYFRLGGRKFIGKIAAYRAISGVYRTVALAHYRQKARKAAVYLCRRAIAYWPFDFRQYKSLLFSLLLDKKSDPSPDWQMPKPLPDI